MEPGLTFSEQSRCLSLACEIQQIPAPTFFETDRAKFVAGKLAAAGLSDVQVIEHQNGITNAYGRLPGASPGPAVLVSAHSDTVFPADTELECRIDEIGKCHGPGIGDNSIAVAALVVLAERLAGRGPHSGVAPASRGGLPCDVWFLCNAAEEGLGDLQGIRAAISWFAGSRSPGSQETVPTPVGAAIVLEGMAFGCVYHRGIAVRRHSVRVTTPGGHSWGNFGSPSAIHELMNVGARIASIEVPAEPRTSFNIGVVSGGTSVNTIAGSASMEIDLRSESTAEVAALEAQVLSIIEAARSEQVAFDITPIGNRPAGEIPRDHPLVVAAASALTQVGAEVRYPNGSTDVNALLYAGIPSVCIGITTGGNPHRTDEWISTSSIDSGLAQLELLTRASADIVAGEVSE